MAAGTSVALLGVVAAAAMAQDSRRPRPFSWLATKGVEAVDLDDVLEGVDLDQLLERVDIDALVQRIDIDALVQRIDIDALVQRIDIDALVQRIDIDALVQRIDIDALVQRIDIDALVQRIDIDALVQRIDIDALVQRIDIDALVQRIDIDALVQRIDIDALVQRIDMDTLLDGVDPDRLLDRVDANRLIARVDLNAVLAGVDVNGLVERVDIDAVMDRVDVVALTERAGIPEIIADSTGAVAGSLLDVIRRQLVAIDSIVERFVWGLLRRDPAERPAAPEHIRGLHPLVEEGRGQVSGHYAGPVSRSASFILDGLILFWSFTFASAGLSWIGQTFGFQVPEALNYPWIGLVLFATYYFLYWWFGLALTGKTFGKGIIGLRVLQDDGDPITGGEAAIRTLVLPFSFLTLAIGVIWMLVSPTRRTLHDAAAKTCEVYDWGERPAEMPAPITAWIAKKAGVVIDESTTIHAQPGADQ